MSKSKPFAFCCILLSIAFLHSGQPASAATIYDQDFDALTPGSIAGQDAWLVNFGSADVQGAVAVAGQALELHGEAQRSGLFAASLAQPEQTLTFSIRLQDTVGEVGGSLLDIQHTAFILGPDTSQQLAFVYKGLTDAGGAVIRDRFEVRGSTTEVSPVPLSGVWYDVELLFDLVALTVDAEVRTGGGTFWNPSPVSFAPNGNMNLLRLTSSGLTGFFFDDLSVVPEPHGVQLVLLSLILLASSRRSSTAGPG